MNFKFQVGDLVRINEHSNSVVFRDRLGSLALVTARRHRDRHGRVPSELYTILIDGSPSAALASELIKVNK